MFTLFVWLLIALLGFAIYAYPAFYVRQMYEPFTTMTATNPVSMIPLPATTIPAVTEQNQLSGLPTIPVPRSSGPAPAARVPAVPTDVRATPNAMAGPAPDLATLMRNIQTVLQPQLGTPELQSTTLAVAPTAEVVAKGATAQPASHDKVRSQPSTANVLPATNASLELGKVVQKQQQPQQAAPTIIREIVKVPVPVPEIARCPRTNACPVPPAACPRLRNTACPRLRNNACPVPPTACPRCPSCPDMSAYIRKDSIPCWGCKLK